MWLIILQRNAFHAAEIDGNLVIYIGDFAYEIRVRAVRHVIREKELPLEQRRNFTK